ncbi:MAG: sensor histidine kinase, partial [Bacteriovorax sp.]
KVTIAMSADDHWAEISVHNEGEPISLEEQKYLFNQYSRTKSAVGSGQIGWGIGLSLVKGLAEAHGGTVRIESDSQSGTTFIVRLSLDARKNSK